MCDGITQVKTYYKHRQTGSCCSKYTALSSSLTESQYPPMKQQYSNHNSEHNTKYIMENNLNDYIVVLGG